MDVKAGLAEVNQRIARACHRAGRDVASVKLVAVSKTQPIEKIRQAMAAGHRIFGENYAQELRDKAAELPDAEWHFVGALQSNKVKMLAGKVALVHTCDRPSLAKELSKRGLRRVLLEVNIGREPQKAGILPDDAPALLGQIRDLVQVDGLMCIPPAEGDPRPHFRALRELAEKLGVKELSMGMSADYETAIEEGATIVRVGTAIFGARL